MKNQELNKKSKVPKKNKIRIDIPRPRASHKICIVCNSDKNKLGRVKITAVIDAFIHNDILIPEGSRCCQNHLDSNQLLSKEALMDLEVYNKESNTSDEYLKKVLEELKSLAKKNNLFSKFENIKSITEDMCIRNTGFNKNQFIEISESISSMRDSESRTKTLALAIYLFWLRTGLSQELIATHFDSISQLDVSRYCDQVRDALTKDFVVKNIGANIKTRTEWLKHNCYVAKELFDLKKTQFSIICDGTYCYIQKSTNNLIQRLTYSVQKGRPLVKPFVICTTDGFIIDIFGFYEATKND